MLPHSPAHPTPTSIPTPRHHICPTHHHALTHPHLVYTVYRGVKDEVEPMHPQALTHTLFLHVVGEATGVHEGPRAHAMATDGTPFVQPLLSTGTPGFLSYHSEIPYSKGASLMVMLEAYWQSVGEDAFRVMPTDVGLPFTYSHNQLRHPSFAG